MSDQIEYDQFFLSYTGTKLPLKMVGAIDVNQIDNRNTYFGVKRDSRGNTVLIHKLVYGDIELSHRYGYDEQNNLHWAELTDIDGECRRLVFDVSGQVVGDETIERS